MAVKIAVTTEYEDEKRQVTFVLLLTEKVNCFKLYIF